MKPYLRLAYTLILIGAAMFTFERFGLNEFRGTLQLNATMVTILVVAPVVFVLAGCVVFIYGKMRRL